MGLANDIISDGGIGLDNRLGSDDKVLKGRTNPDRSIWRGMELGVSALHYST